MNAKEALGPWLKRYWGLEIVMSDSHTVQLSDAAIQALRELVALKDMKDSLPTINGNRSNFGHYADALAEYERRKPLAWVSARAVLSASESSENEATK